VGNEAPIAPREPPNLVVRPPRGDSRKAQNFFFFSTLEDEADGDGV